MPDKERQAVLLAMRSDTPMPESMCLNRLWYNLTVGCSLRDEGSWGRHMSEHCRAQLMRHFDWLS